MFLLENVKNLKTHDKGRTYETITKTLRDMDYEVDSILYKARDFGAPQNRERIYIVGFDKLSLKILTYLSFQLHQSLKLVLGIYLKTLLMKNTQYQILFGKDTKEGS